MLNSSTKLCGITATNSDTTRTPRSIQNALSASIHRCRVGQVSPRLPHTLISCCVATTRTIPCRSFSRCTAPAPSGSVQKSMWDVNLAVSITTGSRTLAEARHGQRSSRLLPRQDYPPGGPIRVGKVITSLKKPYRPPARLVRDAEAGDSFNSFNSSQSNVTIEDEKRKQRGLAMLTTWPSGLLGLGHDVSADLEPRHATRGLDT